MSDFSFTDNTFTIWRNAALEFSILRTSEYPVPSIIDTVNIIRTAKNGTFAEWKNSDTAKLYGM